MLLRASDPLPTPSIIDFRKAEDLQAQVFGSLSRTGCASGEIRGCCARRGSGGGGDGGGGWHGRIAEPGRSRVDGGSINGDVNISVRTQTRNNQNNSNKRNNNLRTPGTPGARVEGVRWRMGTELDSDSVSRMEGIRRGAGGQETQKQRGRDKRTSAVNEAGAAIERGGDMEERRRGSLFPERQENSCQETNVESCSAAVAVVCCVFVYEVYTLKVPRVCHFKGFQQQRRFVSDDHTRIVCSISEWVLAPSYCHIILALKTGGASPSVKNKTSTHDQGQSRCFFLCILSQKRPRRVNFMCIINST